MYSDVPGGTPPYQFTFMTDKCGSYSQEGDCYNREHSFPQSWFNKASPMKSDLFHVYPTDGYVNGKRSSYPYGEVSNPVWTSQNGSKLGPCSASGYSGTVFEPIDAYKGDFARTYFYMAVRYYHEDAGWQNNAAVNGSQMKPWFLNMLYQWHLQDTVSQKEIDRNNAVYNIQHNRNPFIDRPDWVDSLWFPSSSLQNTKTGDFKFSVFPNPVNEECNILILNDIKPTVFKISIYDITGRLMNFQKISGGRMIKISTSDLKTGVYFVSLVDNNNGINRKFKIIKQ
jgi:endonuclease I